MALINLPINTGTGPGIAVDTVGTANYQVVKIAQAGSGSAGALGDSLVVSVTGTANVAVANDITVGSMPIVTVTGTVGTLFLQRLDATNDSILVKPTYPVDSTAMGATASGMVMLGMQTGATTARGIAVTTTGAAQVQVVGTPTVTAANVTVASVTAHGWNVVGGGAIASGTGTGPLIMGIATAGTIAKPIAVSSTGYLYVQSVVAMPVLSATNVTIASITTGTVSIAGTVSTVSTVGAIAGVVTVTASANPLRVVVNAITGNVVVSSVTTGTMNVINVLSATGVLLAATTANVGAFVGTAHASRWDAYAVNTTSGAGAIVKTSGAHTLYITDLMVSVDVPMMVTIYSSVATTKAVVYLATKGGFVFPLTSPMVLNSAQSLIFQGNASGSHSCYAAGYTVT